MIELSKDEEIVKEWIDSTLVNQETRHKAKLLEILEVCAPIAKKIRGSNMVVKCTIDELVFLDHFDQLKEELKMKEIIMSNPQYKHNCDLPVWDITVTYRKGEHVLYQGKEHIIAKDGVNYTPLTIEEYEKRERNLCMMDVAEIESE